MSKVFISYRRKSWAFTRSLAEALRERLDATVFWDVDGIDQPDFEKAILKHLRESNVVLLVITDLTFSDRIHRDDDWVRREIREALTLNLPLVMVCVDGLLPPTGLPDDIKDITRMQGVNFYPDYFIPAVEKLIEFLYLVSSVERKGTLKGGGVAQAVSGIGVVGNQSEHPINGRTTLFEALDLLEQEDFSKVIFLLEELRNSGFKFHIVDIDQLLQEVKVEQQKVERRRLAQINYEEIAALVKRRLTREKGLAAFKIWEQEFSDLVTELDLDNIHQFIPTHLEDYARNQPVLLIQDVNVNRPEDTMDNVHEPNRLQTPHQQELAKKFHDTEVQVQSLREEYKLGQLTRAQLQEQLKRLMILDENNNWWMMGVETDTWYRFQENEWVVANAPFSYHYSTINIMPKPFEWIDIPAGNVTLITLQGWDINYIPAGTSQTLRVPKFEIAKYPVTNSQFTKFVEASGYDDKKWWTVDGWKTRQNEGWSRPRYSSEYKWNKPTHPVIGISWYEAIAYSRWLSEITEEKIKLPTEQQWQRAAQGETKWKYPYGEHFDEMLCNFNTQETSDVRKYSGKGDSPFGVVDMSGNVWEWCLTEYETGDTNLEGVGNRILRGGSWFDEKSESLDVNLRINVNPSHQTNHWGFRIIRL